MGLRSHQHAESLFARFGQRNPAITGATSVLRIHKEKVIDDEEWKGNECCGEGSKVNAHIGFQISAARQNIDPCHVLHATWRTGFKKCLDSRSTRITTTQILNRPIRLIFSAAKAIVAHSTHIGRWLFTSQNREMIFGDITTLTWKTVKDF